ncbi:type II toxin-antitoxin system Phd/YefM family antitoxin [Sphingobium sp. YR768]|uniref:type II toxin-antitoxin system Phd/YefM family antitoxin n=1 Tax=Sphingobium sp. YR768 TaxID=1884365 RepID=UPI0008B66F5F|nr:type II toxin-antitoxin system Phd/YefM family antitoxin [Sphingobium sp. YR768]SER94222.1 prevent-host-death family protein [Sphingobium sp. YR768]
MRYSTRIKPISYFKANAAEVLAELNDGAEPMILTQNGEAKAIIQDIRSYEKTQETLAMLKILALGMQDIEAGRVRPAREVFEEIKANRRKNNG